jgi:hypothetical protein
MIQTPQSRPTTTLYNVLNISVIFYGSAQMFSENQIERFYPLNMTCLLYVIAKNKLEKSDKNVDTFVLMS